MTDPAWLEAQYNCITANPDYASQVERWNHASEQARRTLPCRTDLRFGPGPKQTADWFGPPRAQAPVFVFVHGGYWSGSDKSVYSFIARPFVEAGAEVVLTNYDLCPDVTVPDIVRQTREGLAWVARELAARGGAPQRVVVCGHSAGGQLAAMMLATDWPGLDAALPPRWLRHGLAISGLFELEPLRHTPFLQPRLRLTPEQVAQASPARLPAPRDTTLYSVVGGGESSEFRRQNRLLAEHWGAPVVPVCEEIGQRRHFDILDDLVDPAGRLHALARELLGLGAEASA